MSVSAGFVGGTNRPCAAERRHFQLRRFNQVHSSRIVIVMSKCLQCGTTPTIKAHLVPKAFVMEVKATRGEQHLILMPGQQRPLVSPTGLYDPDLLCAECDGMLGSHEGYAHSLLQQLRGISGPVGSSVPIPEVNGDRMVRFASAIAWKFSATRTQFGRINVGPYSDVLQDAAFSNNPIPSSLDVALIRLMELDGDVYFYRNPKLDRHDDVNLVRFSVGGFLIFLKVDKRPNARRLPPECWLRGRTSGAFLMASAERFEEGKRHRELARQPAVRQFFGTLRDRAARSR